MPRIPLPPHLAAAPFTYAEGRLSGLGRSRLSSADLQRPFHGIRLASGNTDVHSMARALSRRMPDDAFFCSVTAAMLTGVPLPPWIAADPQLHVAVPSPRRAIRVRGVRGHKLQVSPGQVQRWRGLRVSGPELMWLELGAVLALEDLVAAGDHLVGTRSPATDSERLAAALAASPVRRGRPRLREAVELLDPLAESPPESRLRVVLHRHGIDGFISNYPVTTSGGYRYRLDFGHPTLKVALEYQGGYHNDPAQYRRDMTRRSRLEAEGWTVIFLNADDLKNSGELTARIRRTLRLATSRLP